MKHITFTQSPHHVGHTAGAEGAHTAKSRFAMTGHPLRWGTAGAVALAALATSSVPLRHSASTALVRTEAVTRWSEGRAKLTHAVSCQLTMAGLGDLNATVDGEVERDPVADQWLHAEGLA